MNKIIIKINFYIKNKFWTCLDVEGNMKIWYANVSSMSDLFEHL